MSPVETIAHTQRITDYHDRMASDLSAPVPADFPPVAAPLATSWALSLGAANRRPATVACYLADLRRFVEHFGADPATATRADVEKFQADAFAAGLSPATVARRYRSLQQFFRWLDDEGEIEASPMARMKPPTVPVQPPEVVTADELRALLAACAPRGKGEPRRATNKGTDDNFERTRDTAMILLLATTGVRASELVGLHLDDVRIDAGTFRVVGKGGRERSIALVPRAAEAVDRYARHRRRHPYASATTALWLGDRGPFTDSGLRQMLERRCVAAGIRHLNPHLFRHTWAHEAKKRGMADESVMAIAGWSTTQMLQRYGASARGERARADHLRIFGEQ